MKGRPSPEQRALFATTREARREAAPDPNWDALEESLLRKTRIATQHVPSQKESSWYFLFVPVAAIAAACVFFSLRGAPTTASTPVVNDKPPLDGDALPRNHVLTTGEQPLRVVHRGLAEWTLGPKARAVVLEHARVVQIRLEAGTLDAHVVPSSEPERFVVEAAGLRVAVHGTRFRVELREDRSLVEVEEGVVSVQPRIPRDSKAVLLRAPSHEEFTLAGAFLKSGGAPTSARDPKASKSPQASAKAAISAPTSPAEKSSPLTIGQVEAGVTWVVSAVSGCFREHTETSSNMKISVRTTVTLEVALDGAVSSVTFDPPLSPAVQTCSEETVRTVRFAASSEGARVTRVLEIDR